MDEIKYSSIQPIVSRIWNAYGYLRLSHEDGDKKESNSITGQKDLIHDYFNHHPSRHIHNN